VFPAEGKAKEEANMANIFCQIWRSVFTAAKQNYLLRFAQIVNVIEVYEDCL